MVEAGSIHVACRRHPLAWVMLWAAACGVALPGSSTSLHAQGWSATLVVDPYPSPYLSDWQTNPTIASLTVVNLTGRQADVTINFTVVDGTGALVLSGRSDPQLVRDGEPAEFNTASAIGGTTDYDPALEDRIVRTGRFPEGDYTACVLLTDASGFILADNVCADFSTIYPDPPYLLFPFDGDTISVPDPFFEWMPSQAPFDFQIGYVVQIAEVLPNQTARQALTANVLQYEDPGILGSSFQYPLGALPLEDGTRYAWWVQALDQNGIPAASNEGRSEIRTFVYRDGANVDDGGVGTGFPPRLVHTSRATGPLAGMATASYETVRDVVTDTSGTGGLMVPLPFPALALFGDLLLSNLQVETDDVARVVAITGSADLLGQSADVLLVGNWGSSGTGVFAFAVRPLDLAVTDLVAGVDGTQLSEVNFGDARLTISAVPQTLDTRRLPVLVEDFFDGATVDLTAGLNLSHRADIEGTRLQRSLDALGLVVAEAWFHGPVGVDPNVLFGGGPRPAPDLALRATLDVDRIGRPDWPPLASVDILFAVDQELSVTVEALADVVLGGQPERFVLRSDITRDDGSTPPVYEGRLVGAWESPFGLSWLTIDSLTLLVSIDGDSVSALLTGLVPMGQDAASLRVEFDRGGSQSATFTATAPRLSSADLVSFIGAATGVPLATPSNPLVLDSVTVVFTSGETRSLDFSASSRQSFSVRDAFELAGSLLPEAFAPPELDVDVAALVRPRFEAHWVPDSTWGALTGDLTFPDVGADSAGSAAVAFGRSGGQSWVSAQLDLAVRTTGITDLLQRAGTYVGDRWDFPTDLSWLSSVSLDTARLQLGVDTRSDSLWASVGGVGRLRLPDGAGEVATTGTFTYLRVAESKWFRGSVSADIGAVTLPEVMTNVTSLLPGDWAPPQDLTVLEGMDLDSAALLFGFDTQADSMGVRILGTGHRDSLALTASLDFVQRGEQRWRQGEIGLVLPRINGTQAVNRVAPLMAGDWQVPKEFTALDNLVLDSAGVTVGFDTRPDSVGARLFGHGHVGAVTTRADIQAVNLQGQKWLQGNLDVAFGTGPASAVIDTVGSLTPGSGAPPPAPAILGALELDSASLRLGFDSRTDSMGVRFAGNGQLRGMSAGFVANWIRQQQESWWLGEVEVGIGSVPVIEAINRVSAFLTDGWELPQVPVLERLIVDSSRVSVGFNSRTDSSGVRAAAFGHFDRQSAFADVSLNRVGQEWFSRGTVSLTVRGLSPNGAIAIVSSALPGEWGVPDGYPAFEQLAIDSATAEIGWDRETFFARLVGPGLYDQLQARVLLALSKVNLASVLNFEAAITIDVGDINLSRGLELAAGLLPSTSGVQVTQINVGTLEDVELTLGIAAGETDSAWVEFAGGFELGGRTGQASLTLVRLADVQVSVDSTGAGMNTSANGRTAGKFVGTFNERFELSDVVDLLSQMDPLANLSLPGGGPFDGGLDDVALTFYFGARSGFSVSSTTNFRGRPVDVLLATADLGGGKRMLAGIAVDEIAFTDIAPGVSTPLTNATRFTNARIVVTTADGDLPAASLTSEVRAFFRPLHEDDDFTLELHPGLNVFTTIPLEDSPDMRSLVEMLASGAPGVLLLEGSIPAFGNTDMSTLRLRAELPPVSPPGAPAWFVRGQLALEITGRPSVSVVGDLTVDVDGDTLTFNTTSSLNVIPEGGVELALAGGLAAERPWVGAFGIDWLTLNQVRLALGMSPATVRLGFRGDAVIGSKDIDVAAGTRLLTATAAPTGVIMQGSSDDGLALSDITQLQQNVAGANAPIPIDGLPTMALREVDLKIATYDDPDIDVRAGIGIGGRLLVGLGAGGSPHELGYIDLDVGQDGITGVGRVPAFAVGPVRFDTAMVDLALTVPEQHLVLRGDAEVAGLFRSAIDLALSNDSIAFETEVRVFNAFRAQLAAAGTNDLLNPQFRGRFALQNDFGDRVTFEVVRALIPIAQATLTAADGALFTAEQTARLADIALAAAVAVAKGAPKTAMDLAYAAYRVADREYNTARYRHRYHRARCSIFAAWHCAAAGYWASAEAAWFSTRGVTWGTYLSARATYLAVKAAADRLQGELSRARAAVGEARAAVSRVQTAVNDFQRFANQYAACPVCPMPQVPFGVTSAGFEASLDGYLNNSSVSIGLNYHVFGARKSMELRWSASVAETVVNLVSGVAGALFP